MPDMKLVNIPGTGALIYSKMGSGTRAAQDLFNLQKNNTEVFSVNSAGLPNVGGSQSIFNYYVCIGDIVASSDDFEYLLWEIRESITISAIAYIVDADTLIGTSNGQTLLINDESANQIVSISTPSADPGVTQAIWTDMSTVTDGTLTAGDYLKLLPTVVSSGLAMSNLTFRITYTITL